MDHMPVMKKMLNLFEKCDAPLQYYLLACNMRNFFDEVAVDRLTPEVIMNFFQPAPARDVAQKHIPQHLTRRHVCQRRI